MNTVLTIATAIASGVMLAMQYRQLRGADAHPSLKRHRKPDPGLADLLNYAAVIDDGVIVCKDGALLAGWIYRGQDNASSTDEQRELGSMLICKALSNLGNGWMTHVDAVRRPAPDYPAPGLSQFPDPVSEAVDEERRRMFQRFGTMYEGYFVLTVTYLPPQTAQRKLIEAMFDDDISMGSPTAQSHALVERFKRECLTIESRLSAELTLRRLRAGQVTQEDGSVSTQDELLRWLHFCVTGMNHPIALPRNPMYIDCLIGGQEMWSGVVPKIGRKLIHVIAIDGFPLESTPGMLTALAEQPCEYRWSTRFIFLDPHQAVAHLEKFRKKWKQKIRGFYDQLFQTNSGHIDEDAAAMAADAQSAIGDINSGLVTQGYFTSVVVLMHEDRAQLDQSARRMEKAINRLGFTARIETINTMDAYLGSLPAHGVENVRRPLLHTLNLADLLPTSSIWTGANSAPCPHYPAGAPALMYCVAQGSTPFRFNLHVRDLGHTFIGGPTRAGKSTLLAVIALQLRRYAGMSIYAFDNGMSMYPTTRAVGGQHYEVAADSSKLSFCPLQFLATRADRAWAMEWIDTLLALNGIVTTPAQRNEIGNAIMNMHDSGARTFSEFVLTVQDETIREAVRQYTVDGMMGHLLDADRDGLDLCDFTTFEIAELMNLGDKFALPVLLYLFRRVERNLHGQPAVLILDEAWLMLGHPVFRNKIKEWLVSFAKKHCAVIMATQSLVQVEESGILDIIVESTANRIFLANVHANEEKMASLYHRVGLNRRQIDIIGGAIPKRQYYCVSEAGCRMFELALGPLAMAFAGSTDKESVAQIQQLEASFGPRWVDQWLAARKLRLDDYLPPHRRSGATATEAAA